MHQRLNHAGAPEASTDEFNNAANPSIVRFDAVPISGTDGTEMSRTEKKTLD